MAAVVEEIPSKYEKMGRSKPSFEDLKHGINLLGVG